MAEFLPLDTLTGRVEVTSSEIGKAAKPIDFTNVVVVGISGVAGGSDKAYTHTQVAPASSWVIQHSMGKFPAVSVVDSGGSEIMPDVHYVDVNHVTVVFNAATSGKAYLN